ncbi:MAG: sulfotransferase [Litorivicinaceae bacterium]|nr:sulfotransferase [Litorivicinaceae bacterium]
MNLIFITGHRKSGTTLLHNLFDGHPSLNNYPVDLSLLYAFFPCCVNADPSINKKRVSDVIRLSTHGLNGQYLYNTGTQFDSDDFLEIFWKNAGCLVFNNPIVLIKTLIESWIEYGHLDPELPCVVKETSQSINIYRYEEFGLYCKFIHLVRDPRDNYSAIFDGIDSYYMKLGEDGKKSLASFINRARMDLKVASFLKEAETHRFFALKFEELLLHTESTMKGVMSFLNLAFDETLFHPTKLGKNDRGNNHLGIEFKGISSQNVGRWKERLSNDDAGVIEFWLREEMISWGYLPSFDQKAGLQAFAEFYKWYNCEYFYFDSFKHDK